MIAELLIFFLRANLVAAVAILVVLVLRAPMRRAFGAHYAYALWPVAPFAVLGAALSAAAEEAPDVPQQDPMLTDRAAAWLAQYGHDRLVLTLWCAGVTVCVILAAISLARFMAAEKAGRAGPAVVGVLIPRLVTPADAAQRFTPQEWRLVRAHERAHMDRQDGRGAAVAAFAQWLCWFNPMLHFAAAALRLDQELACDATVLERLPAERRRYAETLLRTHEEPAVRFGAHFSGCGSLEIRLAMLSARPPSLSRLELGEVLITGLWIAAMIGGVAAHRLI